ncbi:hypothetical protein CsatA_010168 [Cannabis sativa]
MSFNISFLLLHYIFQKKTLFSFPPFSSNPKFQENINVLFFYFITTISKKRLKYVWVSFIQHKESLRID